MKVSLKELPALVCSLLAVGLALLLTSPAKAASLQLEPNWVPNGVPTNMSMYAYVPDNVAPNPPILVLLHYWGGTAASVFGQAQAGGIVAAADQYGFIMVVPQRSADCWDSGSAQTLTHDGGGETHGIAQMVRYAITNYHANADRVYVTGDSCGAMMTEAMLAVYPDMFKAGVAFAGQTVGGAWTPVTHTAQEWGDIVRACYPGYSGPRPRVQLWHGTADGLISYSNQVQSIAQWGNVLGLSTNPTSTTTGVKIGSITNDWTHQVWVDACGHTVLDAWSEIGGTHDIGALFNAQYVIPFLGLDKLGPVDPRDPDVFCGNAQRGRPTLNAARTTFVADNGERLRGPYTSTEWTSASPNVSMIKGMGFNALHLYAEAFDKRYPTNGSTAPGYAVANVDSIVAQTRTNGLYLIMTIGNGAWNGDYNAAYVTNFWKFYAQRYANETHVLFEIQNEPVAWGPPYSSPTATPPGALDMEVATYKIIRQYAPNTPVLLFSYAVLGDSGGASAALTDIHAFNTNVFGTANVTWTNEAVGFHGYAGASATSNAVSQIIAAGYPCFMTEFGGGVWGTGVPGLDAYGVANLERLGVSWLTFQYIPPTGVSDDVSKPKHYADIVNWSGLSWTPDYGHWPPVRGAYSNGGYPWATPRYANNTLTGSLRIQAENFDSGGEGIAYHDQTATNLGGQYRTSNAVDIETTTDTGGGYDVTGTVAGEWLEYTIYVSEAGFYNLALRVAGTSAGSVRFVAGGINGTNLTGNWTVPATGGAQTWTTISNVVFLTPGQQILHLDVLSGGFNLNWLQFSPVASGNFSDGSYKLLNASSALAVTGVSSNNKVVAASYTGTTAQRWNFQHIGGGQYKITSVENGWSLTSGGFYFWIDKRYFIQAAGDGYYRLVPSDSGFCFETASTNQSVVGEKVSTGGINQRWAVVAPSAPAFPTGLGAVAVSWNQIGLTWNAVAGATSYNLKRATNSGGPYTTIASGITATNYTDTASTAVNYYYVVSAVSGGTESLNSAEAALSLPYPWQTQDVGTVGVAGSASHSNGVFAVSGSGDDIWNAADAFRFVCTTVTGDCTLIARVVSVPNINGWSKAGVMIRQSTDANSANAFMAVTPGNGVTWQYRSSAGANSANAATGGLSAPYWVKLVRSGNTFTGYRSADGTSWTQQGTATISMTGTVYVGLAVTSHNNSSLCAAVFDNVTVPGWPPPTTPTGLTAVASYGNQVSLTWNGLTGATGYNVKRATVSGGPYTTLASGIAATNFTDFVASVRAGYFYVVSATVDGSETGNSPEATVRFPELAGAIIGTAGSWNSSGNTITNVFDGNLNTFFDAPISDGSWVGLDFGAGVTNVITQINYSPRADTGSRMVGGVFQGANNSSFTGAVTLYTITSSPVSGVFTTVNITNLSAFRYVRYLSPNGGWGNVAELEFYGYQSFISTAVPSSPAGLAATTVSSSQNNLAWNAVTNAASYNLKRSTTNGGPYVIIASGLTATNFNDTGLAAATTYYYVASAVNAGGESANSTQASATTLMPAPAAPAGLVATAVSASQINLTWNTVATASGYNVKRALTNGGPYTVVASGVTATNYPDSGLAGGTIYYYVVSAVNAGGESTNSAQATATTWSGTLGSLVHRYNFIEPGGAAIADSVGGPIWNGALPNGGTFASGQLTLASASSQYASLPTGIVSSLSNFTIVAWVRLNSTTNWSRIFDFGSGMTTNMFLTPQNGGDGRLRFAITTSGGGGEQQINCGSTMTTGVWYQVAVTLNGNKGVLYLNGLPVGTNNAMTLRPSSLGNTGNNYLGRSQYPDPYFNGLIDEFRIYNTGLSPAEIAATAALGASQQLSTNSPQMNVAITGVDLTLSWPLECAGYTLQSRTNLGMGDWLNVASPVPQIVGSQWQVTLASSGNSPSVFYRLLK